MQCGAESDFLQQAPGKDMCDPVRVQLKPHQRPQHVGDARMLNIRLGKLQAAREPAPGRCYGLQLEKAQSAHTFCLFWMLDMFGQLYFSLFFFFL